MGKRAAATKSSDSSSTLTLTDHLSDSAQRELAALRRALETRLNTLEEVLADPARGESLAGLILDLSRVATEEAQLAASQACIATRAEAEKELDGLRASAKAAQDAAQANLKSVEASLEFVQASLESVQTSLDHERATGADLRRAIDQARAETDKQAELLAAREQLEASLRSDRDRLEAEVVRQQTIIAGLQQKGADAQRLETERAAAEADYRKATTELTREREAAAGREHALADLQAQLEAERATVEDLRLTAEQVATELATLARERAEAGAARDGVAAELAREREAAAGHSHDLADMQAQLEAERATVEDLRLTAKQVATELATLAHERAEAVAARDAVAAELAGERQATAGRGHDLADMQAQLEAERATVEDLRRVAEQAGTELATLTRERAEAAAARDAAAAELGRERETLGGLERVRAEAESRLEAERAARAEVQSQLEAERAARAEAQSQLESERSARTEPQSQLEAERAGLAKVQSQLKAERSAAAQARSELEAAQAATADLRATIESVELQLASARGNEAQAVANHDQFAAQAAHERAEAAKLVDALTAERDVLLSELRSAHKESDDHRDEKTNAATRVPHVKADTSPTPPAPTKPPAKTVAAAGSDDPWQPIRLATRFAFSEDVIVQINNDPAKLYDLSTSGCQVVSATALKPNQKVKVSLPSEKKALTYPAQIVWTKLESAAIGQPLVYRAGVRFTKVDEAAIRSFAARYGATI